MSLGKRKRIFIPSRAWRLAVFLSAALLLLALSGCMSQQEISYHNQINTIRDRWNDLSKNLGKIGDDFGVQMESLAKQPSEETYAKIIQLVETYMPQFQQYLTEFQKLQIEMSNIQAPPKYATAHSIYNSGLSSAVTSASELIRGIDMIRQPEHVEEALYTIQNAPNFLKQGIDNLNKADDIVFPVNWTLIVGVIIGFFIVVAGIIAFFVYLSRRRRYKPGHLAPGPVGAYQGPGYPPPPVAYRSPSEAYPPLPGDIYSAPAPQGYPPPPEAGSTPPGTPPESPPKQPVTCPRCGAEITAAGAFCPSCNAMLPGI